MNGWLREQLALRAANSKNIFTVYKHSSDGKVLTNAEHVNKYNALQENISILQNSPVGSTIEETELTYSHYGEEIGMDIINCWQLRTDQTWERI